MAIFNNIFNNIQFRWHLLWFISAESIDPSIEQFHGILLGLLPVNFLRLIPRESERRIMNSYLPMS